MDKRKADDRDWQSIEISEDGKILNPQCILKKRTKNDKN